MVILPIKVHPHLSILSIFQDFWSPQPSMSTDPIWKRSIWDIRFFYISSFIKIQSPIPKIPWFSHFPTILVSLSNSPKCHQIRSIFEIRVLKAQDPSKYQFSWRSDHLLVSYKYLFFSIFSNSPPPLPPPKRADLVWLWQSRILDLCLFFPPSLIIISLL